MSIFRLTFTVHKKPYTDNTRVAIVNAPNLEHAIQQLRDYYDAQKKYELRVKYKEEYSSAEPKIISNSTI